MCLAGLEIRMASPQSLAVEILLVHTRHVFYIPDAMRFLRHGWFVQHQILNTFTRDVHLHFGLLAALSQCVCDPGIDLELDLV